MTEQFLRAQPALAERHGLAPLLDLPGARRRARVDWLRLEQALLGALRILPDAVVYKGAAHALDLYESPELRPCGDVDLIHPTGELPWPVAVRSAHEISYRAPNGIVVDLHRGFCQPERTRLEAGALFARAQKKKLFFFLQADDAVVVHALNMGLHELRVPLVQLADLARLWPRCSPLEVLRKASEARALGALAASIDLLLRHAGDTFAGAPVDRAGLGTLLQAARAELSRATLAGLDWAVSRYDLQRRPLPRLEQLARKALFIDRPLDRLRFACAHALGITPVYD